MSINYQISLNTNTHLFSVALSFTATNKAQKLKLPTWIPGSYMIREFSKNIVDIKISNSDCTDYILTQINKNTWYANNLIVGELITINYSVYALDFGIRTAYLDNNRAYFNCSSLCIYLPEHLNDVHQISLLNIPQDWQIATGLPQKYDYVHHISNSFVAKDYQQLIDCPFELGKLTILEFMVKNTLHRFVLSGNIVETFDKQRLIDDTIKICNTQIDLFGGIAPFDNYTFLLYLGGSIFTGLEHSNSTALMAPYYSLPVFSSCNNEADYIKLLGLVSHEYFHLWNVKRIKPQVFNPYDMDHENYTQLLWWFEGITSYYDNLTMYRAKIIDRDKYLQMILDDLNAVYKFTGHSTQSLINSSLTSWIKYYRQDENSPNAIVSYYVKGSLVGMCLDLLIRRHSFGKKSLDDVILGIYNQWLIDQHGIAEDCIPNLILKYSGVDLTNEIHHMVNTTEEIDFTGILTDFGLRLYNISGCDHARSGKVIQSHKDIISNKLVAMGWKLSKETFGYRVVNVYNSQDSIATKYGFAAGDLLIAINGIKLVDIEKQINLFANGDTIDFTLFRQDQLRTIVVVLTNQSGCDVKYLQIFDDKLLKNWL